MIHSILSQSKVYLPAFCALEKWMYDFLWSSMTEPQPDYSAYREASFGHAIFDIKNRTHAYYSWNRNDDGVAAEADSLWFHNRYWYPVNKSSWSLLRVALTSHYDWSYMASILLLFVELSHMWIIISSRVAFDRVISTFFSSRSGFFFASTSSSLASIPLLFVGSSHMWIIISFRAAFAKNKVYFFSLIVQFSTLPRYKLLSECEHKTNSCHNHSDIHKFTCLQFARWNVFTRFAPWTRAYNKI